jgi:hypothetical protein
MKQRLSLGSLAAVLFLCGLCLPSSGCVQGLRPEIGSTPTLSRQERYAKIGRNWGLEYQMMNDDIDSVLLLRPVSGLTQWSVP